VRVGHDLVGLGGEAVGRKRNVPGPGGVTDGDPADVEPASRAGGDVVRVLVEEPEGRGSDRAAPEEPDRDTTGHSHRPMTISSR
jgi:hypothetical protein